MIAMSKNCWPGVLGLATFQLNAGECRPSIDRALYCFPNYILNKHKSKKIASEKDR